MTLLQPISLCMWIDNKSDGHRVNEDGSFVQGDISLWRVNAAPTICDDTANNFAQTYFVTDWPQR